MHGLKKKAVECDTTVLQLFVSHRIASGTYPRMSSSSSNASFKLNTGATIPAVGLGTWQAPKGEVGKAVEHALKSGYTHIDAAWCYQVCPPSSLSCLRLHPSSPSP